MLISSRVLRFLFETPLRRCADLTRARPHVRGEWRWE